MACAALLITAAASVAVPAIAPNSAAAQAQRDWTRTVAVTPEGGYRMGNPNARVKLVEYASFTCPHCAKFHSASKGPLGAYVRSGKVSFEFRNLVLNGIDVTAVLLARCATPSNFFPLADSLFANQSTWVDKINNLPQAEKDKLKGLAVGVRLGRLADIGGLTQMAAKAGLAPARGKQCLADESALNRLDEMSQAARALGVTGTPTFFLNGSLVRAQTWVELEPVLREASNR